ncbi:MAG TPA: cation-transporting P-type ATPase [Terrimicrobiaceae bacterium]
MVAQNVIGEGAAWHSIASDEVVGKLATSLESGLDSGEVSKRLTQYGPNRLPAPGKRGPLMRFLMQLNNILIYVLLAAGLGKIFLGEFVDAGVIIGVVLITYFPPMQDVFGVEAVPLSVWKWLLLGGVILFLVVELEKFIIRGLRAQHGNASAA